MRQPEKHWKEDLQETRTPLLMKPKTGIKAMEATSMEKALVAGRVFGSA